MSEHVLVLEDDQSLALLLKTRLERMGLRVSVACTVEEARAAVAAEPVSAYVLDYNLRDTTTGLDFYKQMRQIGHEEPAVLVTGFSDESVILEALRSGVRDFIPKNNDFFEHLPLCVHHILSDIARRKEFERLKAESELRERVQSAFDAAQVAYWRWSPRERVVEWAGFKLPVLVELGRTQVVSARQFAGYLGRKQTRKILNCIRTSRLESDHFECRLDIREGKQTRWILIRGRVEHGAKTFLAGIAMDVTAQYEAERQLRESFDRIQQLNERLAFSMTETHHRVKNSLQTVSSLLGIEFRTKKGLDAEGLKRIVGHVRALALLHDRLTDQARDGRDRSYVDAGTFLEDLVNILQGLIPTLRFRREEGMFPLTARQASSLALIVTELVMNADKYGKRFIHCEAGVTSGGYRITLFNDRAASDGAPAPAPSMSSGTGLNLVRALLEADFGTAVSIDEDDGRYRVAFTLPSQFADEPTALGAF